MSKNYIEDICRKLEYEKPVLYFTPDGSEKKCDHLKCGYYEIRESSFGSMILRLEHEDWNRLGGCVDMAWKDHGFLPQKHHNADLFYALRLIERTHVRPSEKSVCDIKNLFKYYTETKKQEQKPAEPVKGPTALEALDAFMKVLNRPRPCEPSDFIPESFIADINDRQR